jgi:hypothetical protein
MQAITRRPLLLAAVGKAANQPNQTTLYRDGVTAGLIDPAR